MKKTVIVSNNNSLIQIKFITKCLSCFVLLMLIQVFYVKNVEAANISSVTANQTLNFGKVAAAESGSGTIKTNCAVTGGVKSFGTCATGTFTVTGTNDVGNRNIKVFITTTPVNLLSGTDTAPASFSLSSSSSVTTKQYNNFFSSGSGTKTATLTIYGTLTVANSASQDAGTYSNNYTIYVCSCTFLGGCPSAYTDSRCS